MEIIDKHVAEGDCERRSLWTQTDFLILFHVAGIFQRLKQNPGISLIMTVSRLT